MTTTSTKRRRTRKQRKAQTDRTKRRKLFFFERESWPRRRIRSFVSLLSWRDLRRVAARDKKTPLESARIGFKSNNNINVLIIIASGIALPHFSKVVRKRERLYLLRLREKTNGALLTKSSSLSSSWLLLLNDIIIDDDWRVVPIGFRAIVAEHTSEQPPRRRRRRRRCDDSSSSPVDRRRGRKHFKILF